jgi:hypothetical protein
MALRERLGSIFSSAITEKTWFNKDYCKNLSSICSLSIASKSSMSFVGFLVEFSSSSSSSS